MIIIYYHCYYSCVLHRLPCRVACPSSSCMSWTLLCVGVRCWWAMVRLSPLSSIWWVLPVWRCCPAVCLMPTSSCWGWHLWQPASSWQRLQSLPCSCSWVRLSLGIYGVSNGLFSGGTMVYVLFISVRLPLLLSIMPTSVLRSMMSKIVSGSEQGKNLNRIE